MLFGLLASHPLWIGNETHCDSRNSGSHQNAGSPMREIMRGGFFASRRPDVEELGFAYDRLPHSTGHPIRMQATLCDHCIAIAIMRWNLQPRTSPENIPA